MQISIHQTFRLNDTNFYTIFDLPIAVTNSIPQSAPNPKNSNVDNGASNVRPLCSALNNALLDASVQRASVTPLNIQPWIGGGVSISGTSSGPGSTVNNGNNDGSNNNNNNNNNGGKNNGNAANPGRNPDPNGPGGLQPVGGDQGAMMNDGGMSSRKVVDLGNAAVVEFVFTIWGGISFLLVGSSLWFG